MVIVEVSYLKLVSILIGFMPIIYFLKKFKIYLIKDLIVSIIRMFIQLIAVGIYLKYIFNYNNIVINILYLIFMISITAITCGKNINLKKRGSIYIFLSMAFIISIVLTIFIKEILNENLRNARYFVPISGMLLGNMLKTSIISLNNFFNYFKENESEYEYLISLGANKYEALLGNVRQSILLSIKPIISSVATMGLVSLPGMMTGQILGGASPTTAIKYQIGVMLLILMSEFYNVIILLFLSIKLYFDGYDMLKEEYFKE
ncbi:ABC transporter permease [uncultured Cetobacterium sp.]|uniref:ABC transporter permease n=1 Tax=uncultured Cetobacterium sp. TaxID=527638 RepID=UPI002602BC1A|nr:ABC transporter permease [uncultured Cetobacterium sp.]